MASNERVSSIVIEIGAWHTKEHEGARAVTFPLVAAFAVLTALQTPAHLGHLFVCYSYRKVFNIHFKLINNSNVVCHEAGQCFE